MAAAMAMNQQTGLIQSLIEAAARRIDEVSGHRFGNWLKDSTGLTPLPSFLTGQNFGVVKALQSTRTPPSLGDMLIETVNYTIEEARERLSALVNGQFIPASVAELYDYLRSHSFELETRINKLTGEMVNFLVDRDTKTAVPAAQVDPVLAQRNILRLELQNRLREQIGGDTPAAAFDSWGGMAWTRDSVQSKFGYTVENGQGYFGRVVGIVSDIDSENEKLLAELRARKIDVIVPRSGGKLDKPVVGMPILVRGKSMRAEEVNRNLDHELLSQKFGGSMKDYYVKKAERANSPVVAAANAKVVSTEEFSRRFLSQEKDIAPAGDQSFGFGAPTDDMDIVIKTSMSGQLYAWDRKANSDVPSSINCLPFGEYERIGSDGELAGYTTVGENGHVSHLDRNRRDTARELPQGIRVRREEPTVNYGF